MARINIGDKWFADPRRDLLAKILGDEDKVDGFAIRAWRIAQRYWQNNRKLVPKALWLSAGFQPMLDCDLAEDRPDGIYCRGTMVEFEWIHDLNATKVRAGQESAKARREKYGTAIPPHASNLPSAEQTEHPPNTCSDSVRPNSRTRVRTKPNALALYNTKTSKIFDDEPTPGSQVWAAYQGSYFARYAVAPVRNAKTNRNCCDLVKRLGLGPAIDVVRFYLSHQGSFYVQKSHALGLCLADCESLHTQMMNGKTVTAATAAVKERQQTNLDAARGALEILEAQRERKS